MASHWLKVDPPVWPSVKAGLKTAELRFNDRNYQVGDVLYLYMFCRETQAGDKDDFVVRVVTHMLPGGQYGIEPGYCLLSMR